jgi:hypothetical protein
LEKQKGTVRGQKTYGQAMPDKFTVKVVKKLFTFKVSI